MLGKLLLVFYPLQGFGGDIFNPKALIQDAILAVNDAIRDVMNNIYTTAEEATLWAPYPGSTSDGNLYIFRKPPGNDVFASIIETANTYMEPIALLILSVGIIIVLAISTFDASLPGIDLGTGTNRQKMLIAPVMIIMWVPIAALILATASGMTDLMQSIVIDFNAPGGGNIPSSYTDAVDSTVQGASFGQGILVFIAFLTGLITLLVALLSAFLRAFVLLVTFAVGPLAIAFWAINFKSIDGGIGSLGTTSITWFIKAAFYPVPAALALQLTPLFIYVIYIVSDGSQTLATTGIGGYLAPIIVVFVVPVILFASPLVVVYGLSGAIGLAKKAAGAQAIAGIAGGAVATKGMTSVGGTVMPSPREEDEDGEEGEEGEEEEESRSLRERLTEPRKTIQNTRKSLGQTRRRAGETLEEKSDLYAAGRQKVAETSFSDMEEAAADSDVLASRYTGAAGDVLQKSAGVSNKMSRSKSGRRSISEIAQQRRMDEEDGIPDDFDADADTNLARHMTAQKKGLDALYREGENTGSLAKEHFIQQSDNINSEDDWKDKHNKRMASYYHGKMEDQEFGELDPLVQEEVMNDMERVDREFMMTHEDRNEDTIYHASGINRDDTITMADGTEADAFNDDMDGGVDRMIAQGQASDEIKDTVNAEELSAATDQAVETFKDKIDELDELDLDDEQERSLFDTYSRSGFDEQKLAKEINNQYSDEIDDDTDITVDDLDSLVDEGRLETKINEDLETEVDEFDVSTDIIHEGSKAGVTSVNSDEIVTYENLIGTDIEDASDIDVENTELQVDITDSNVESGAQRAQSQDIDLQETYEIHQGDTDASKVVENHIESDNDTTIEQDAVDFGEKKQESLGNFLEQGGMVGEGEGSEIGKNWGKNAYINEVAKKMEEEINQMDVEAMVDERIANSDELSSGSNLDDIKTGLENTGLGESQAEKFVNEIKSNGSDPFTQMSGEMDSDQMNDALGVILENT